MSCCHLWIVYILGCIDRLHDKASFGEKEHFGKYAVEVFIFKWSGSLPVFEKPLFVI